MLPCCAGRVSTYSDDLSNDYIIYPLNYSHAFNTPFKDRIHLKPCNNFMTVTYDKNFIALGF